MPQKNELIHSGSSTSPLFICGKAIRSSSFRGTNIYKPQNSLSYLSYPPMGGFADKCPKGKPDLNYFLLQVQSAPATLQGVGVRSISTVGRGCRRCQGHALARRYPKSAEYSKSSKHSKGKPQLNGFSTSIKGTAYVTHFVKGSEVVSLSRRQHSREEQVDLGEAFELDSNRSNTAVNQEKILFQYKNSPPLNPITNKKIDQQKIPLGFGGGAEGGGGSVGVEFESNCSRIAVNKAKTRPLQTLSTFDIGKCRESYSEPDGIRSSQKSTIFYSKLIMKMVGGNIRI